MTHGDMKNEVIRTLGLQDITDYDETGMVANWIYRGIIDMLSRTRCVVRCVNMHVRAGVDEYTLDHSILALVDVGDGLIRRLRRDESITPEDATVYAPNPPISNTVYGFTLIRADLLRVEPTPTLDGTLQVWGVMRPTQMTQDTDNPGDDQFGALPDEYQDAPILYALWKGSDYSDDASSQQGERYRMLYEGQDGRGGRLGQIRVLVNKRGTARAPRSRVTLSPLTTHDSWL